jgi:hypothetical protein
MVEETPGAHQATLAAWQEAPDGKTSEASEMGREGLDDRSRSRIGNATVDGEGRCEVAHDTSQVAGQGVPGASLASTSGP